MVQAWRLAGMLEEQVKQFAEESFGAVSCRQCRLQFDSRLYMCRLQCSCTHRSCLHDVHKVVHVLPAKQLLCMMATRGCIFLQARLGVAMPEACPFVVCWLRRLLQALYEAVLAGRQPGDGTLRVQHPTDPGKKTKRLSGKGSKKGSAAADEGAALAARLKRKTAAAAGKKDAAPKRPKPNRSKAAVSSEDTEEGVGCSEDDAPGDGKAAAEVGSDDDEWFERHEQQQQQQQGVQQAGMGVESDKRPRRNAGLPLRLQE